ncbi:MAG: DEAD/DEAH box helicase family protein [Methylophilaceae bacterium]
MIDFKKISGGQNSDTALQPRDIFIALPEKVQGKFQYPRDVQSQVWDKWFARRNEQNLVLKMNTGSGKTVVGLLILKSSLNEGHGPAVYVVPDNYLVKQVIDEAKNLGIPVTENHHSPRFLSGKEILIINIHKLVNGRSVFGVGDEGIKIKIGSLIVDDAHACIDTIEEQFTLSITPDNPAFDVIYNEFKPALSAQCSAKAIELETGDPTAYMLVPFWAWQNKLDVVQKTLIKNKTHADIEWVWPLIKENLKLSRCVISSTSIEISPHCIPIHMIPSLHHAQRRVYMTATLVDDSILVSHFGVTDDSILSAIAPTTAGDIGDRMILMPQIINQEFSDVDIKKICAYAAKQFNVVIIVPSESRANFWADVANLTLKKDNIYDGIEQLKAGHVGIAVLVNRYDGVDLPQDACRLLVIDGVPDVRRLIDKVEQGVLLGSEQVSTQILQRVEQGMGRGVRASDDFCAVLLLGKSLISNIYAGGAIEKFSPGTKAQIQLSEQVSMQITNQSLKELWETINYCLSQDKDWVSASKGALTNIAPLEPKQMDKVTLGLRQAYDFASANNLSKAPTPILAALNSVDKLLSSYLKQCAAEYFNLYDEVEAQKLLLSASEDNTRVLKPLAGIGYHKLESKGLNQARAVKEYLATFPNPNVALIKLNGLLEDLIFKPDTANKFEEAMKQIALFIGFTSQRPENEYGKGPDVLWGIGNLEYLVIECKNGAVVNTIAKHYCNQLNGSGEWFRNKYDASCSFTPIMIHPSNTFEYAASPNANTRIMIDEDLANFRTNLLGFIKSICTENKMNNEVAIKDRLIHYQLNSEQVCSTHTRTYAEK